MRCLLLGSTWQFSWVPMYRGCSKSSTKSTVAEPSLQAPIIGNQNPFSDPGAEEKEPRPSGLRLEFLKDGASARILCQEPGTGKDRAA